MSADLFARTKIEPGALVQTLDLDAASGTSAGRGERERSGPGLRVHSAGADRPRASVRTGRSRARWPCA